MIVLSALVTPVNRRGEDKVGEGTSFRCKRCNHEFSALFGCGMFDWLFLQTDSSTNKPYYHKHIDSAEVIVKVDQIVLTEENVREEDFHHRRGMQKRKGEAPYYCLKCKTIKNNYNFRLIFTGGSYEPTYFCEKCNSELLLTYDKLRPPYGLHIVASGEPIELHCPQCGHDEVEEYEFMNWD